VDIRYQINRSFEQGEFTGAGALAAGQRHHHAAHLRGRGGLEADIATDHARGMALFAEMLPLFGADMQLPNLVDWGRGY
jgi:hypothetical protein